MELANNRVAHRAIRPAKLSDGPAIDQLLTHEFYAHRHVDWYEPLDWLGEPGFVVWEERGRVVACLAATADPPPAAWVRVLAMGTTAVPLNTLPALFDHIAELLLPEGITHLNWLANKRWPEGWLSKLGFQQCDWLQGYEKRDVLVPSLPPAAVPIQIRPVLPEDFYTLEKLEAKAFDPLWRYSGRALHRGWRQSISFDVILDKQHGRVIGFQHSVPGQGKTAHLARITIDPDYQGQGVGSALLAHTIENYARQELTGVSLNTQEQNQSSHHLYLKFGFERLGQQAPIWQRPLSPND